MEKHINKIKIFLLLLFLCLFAHIFAGCSRNMILLGGNNVKEGGVLVFGITENEPSFINFENIDSVKSIVTSIYETLVCFYPGQEGPQPLLAESWEISGDKLNYIFNIKKGIYFHDKTVLNAYSVAKSLDILKRKERIIPGSQNSVYKISPNIKEITVLDDYKIRITLLAPDPFFIISLADLSASIRKNNSSSNIDKTIASYPVGTGPFKIVAAKKNENIITDRFEDYRGKFPHIERIVFRFIPDTDAGFLALKAGDINLLNVNNAVTVEKIRKSNKFNIVSGFGGKALFIFFNPEKPLVKKKELRLSVLSAFDRANFANEVFRETPVISADNFPYLFRFTGAGSKISYNADFAKSLLSELDNKNPSLYCYFSLKESRPDNDNIRIMAEKYLQEAGFDFEILASDQLNNAKEKSMADLVITWHNVLYNPEFCIAAVTGANFIENFYGYEKSYSDLIYEALTTSDQEVSSYVFTQAETLISEFLPWSPLVCSSEIYAAEKNIMGVKMLPDGRLDISEIWLNK